MGANVAKMSAAVMVTVERSKGVKKDAQVTEGPGCQQVLLEEQTAAMDAVCQLTTAG
jgi:hypothetical protein